MSGVRRLKNWHEKALCSWLTEDSWDFVNVGVFIVGDLREKESRAISHSNRIFEEHTKACNQQRRTAGLDSALSSASEARAPRSLFTALRKVGQRKSGKRKCE